jgi:hypothetical protein
MCVNTLAADPVHRAITIGSIDPDYSMRTIDRLQIYLRTRIAFPNAGKSRHLLGVVFEAERKGGPRERRASRIDRDGVAAPLPLDC